MKLGNASLHGIVATLYIATHEKEGPIAARVIAEECGIPTHYLIKLIQKLARFPILDSAKGRGGGFTLAKPAGQITLLEIIEVIGGPLTVDPIGQSSIKAPKHSKKKLG